MSFDFRDFTLRDRLACVVGLMRETNGARTMIEAHQLGLDLRTIVSFLPDVERTPEGKTYAVLLVEDAQVSRYTESMRDVVNRFDVRSVLALGGRLVNGDIVGIVLYSRVQNTRAGAEQFRTVALDTTALFRSHEGRVFAA